MKFLISYLVAGFLFSSFCTWLFDDINDGNGGIEVRFFAMWFMFPLFLLSFNELIEAWKKRFVKKG